MRCERNCGREAANKRGLCNSCMRHESYWEKKERDTAQIKAHLERLTAPRPPNRTLRLGHRVFEVVWDGTGGLSGSE